MDTRFWGPPAWRLLHTIAASYNPELQRDSMRDFLEVIPYILPCKYCRISLTEYYEKVSYEDYLGSAKDLSEWMWKIHNLVNDKLRKQGQQIPKDPAFNSIYKYYQANIPKENDSECEMFLGWDFLFSVAYNHPLSIKSVPMPNSPLYKTIKNDKEHNKWNTMKGCERFKYWRKFWDMLPDVLPDPWRIKWLSSEKKECLQNRKSAVAWLWRKRCLFSNSDPYHAVCKRLTTYSSECSKSLKGKTCRKSRSIKRKTIRHKKRS
jgi:hypothetical protein